MADGPIDASGFEFSQRAAMAQARPGRLAHRRVFGVVCAVHLVALVVLLLPYTPRERIASDALVVEFITVPATPDAPPPPSPPSTPAAAAPVATPVRPSAARPLRNAAPPQTPQAAEPPSSSSALQAIEIPPRAAEPATAPPDAPSRTTLFDDSGNIVVPEEAYEDLRRNVSEDRVFDYQIAGLAKAKTAFTRKPALIYEAGQFDGSMRPTKSLLVDLLERAVEASTGSISIPIPGDPYRRIECKVVVLAAGGGCGMTGFTGYVEEDDPNTLNAEEEAQCAAWWEKITTTNQQQAWIETRKLYEAACRKPRETKPPMPDPSD